VSAAALAPDRAEAFLDGADNAQNIFDSATGYPGLWQLLRTRPELAATGELARLIPGTPEIDAATPNEAAAWRPLARALVDAINSAVNHVTP
jgi:hypothetical protein